MEYKSAKTTNYKHKINFLLDINSEDHFPSTE